VAVEGRDRVLHAQGWRVVRITWRQLHNESESIAAGLTRMLV
jgi:very-short-patch-repair endonuclease